MAIKFVRYDASEVATVYSCLNTDDYSEFSPNVGSIMEILGGTNREIVAVKKYNGETWDTTQGNRPTIAIDEDSAIAELPDVIYIDKGDKITLDIDQVGSTVAGENLSIVINCEVIVGGLL